MTLSPNLKKAMATLHKQFDPEMISMANEMTDRRIVSHSTGSLMLDLALGADHRAGFPEGRMIELYGPESAGKSFAVL